MSAMASQIIGVSVVCLTVYSGSDQRKHPSSASLALVRGIHRWPTNSPRKGPVTRKMSPFDDGWHYCLTVNGSLVCLSEDDISQKRFFFSGSVRIDTRQMEINCGVFLAAIWTQECLATSADLMFLMDYVCLFVCVCMCLCVWLSVRMCVCLCLCVCVIGSNITEKTLLDFDKIFEIFLR